MNSSGARLFHRIPVLFPATALAIIALDQATKYWASHLSGLEYGAYPPRGGIEVIPGYLSLVYTTNTGAAWGMFEGHGVILASLGIAAIAAICIFRKALGLDRMLMQFVFGLITGGIAGNIVDRVCVGGVTDFIDFHIRSIYRWPTFNVADSAMVVGVAIYVATALFERDRPQEKADTGS
ncbi:MAG TPA: signal peptidase II [Opitutales bacterium]|nr:signal peptidase II [Opitutales bacterium]